MGEPVTHADPPPTAHHTHEQSDVSIRPLAWFLTALTLSLVGTVLVVAWLFSALLGSAERSDAPQPLVPRDAPTAGPLLQISPRRDMELLRAREEAQLRAVEWVDEANRVVRMPIARAMELAAAGRFPDWPAVDPAAAPEAPVTPTGPEEEAP